MDEASNARGLGTGVVIITPDETVIEQSIRLDFKTSNKEAEYTVPTCHIHIVTVGPCWMDPYVHYLKEGVLPE